MTNEILKMNATEFADLLKSLHACSEARKWAEGKSLQSVWKTCDRGDWLLWLCGRMVNEPGWPTQKDTALAACDCAELALKYVKDGEDRPRKCIDTVRAWAGGNATLDEVRTARRAAASAAADAAAYAADASDAAYAAYAAAYAADADAAVASDAAAAAAYADADASDAADASADADAVARTKTLAKCADIVRGRLYIPTGI